MEYAGPLPGRCKWVLRTHYKSGGSHYESAEYRNKPADQPAKKRATPYHIRVLCLLNCRGWKQLIYKNICMHPVEAILYSVMQRIL